MQTSVTFATTLDIYSFKRCARSPVCALRMVRQMGHSAHKAARTPAALEHRGGHSVCFIEVLGLASHVCGPMGRARALGGFRASVTVLDSSGPRGWCRDRLSPWSRGAPFPGSLVSGVNNDSLCIGLAVPRSSSRNLPGNYAPASCRRLSFSSAPTESFRAPS